MKLVIEPVVFDHQVQNAVEQSDVAAGLDRKEQVAGAGQWSDPRIDDNDVRAVLAGLPYVVGGDGGAFGDIGPLIQIISASRMSLQGLAAPIDPEGLLVAGGGADHA